MSKNQTTIELEPQTTGIDDLDNFFKSQAGKLFHVKYRFANRSVENPRSISMHCRNLTGNNRVLRNSMRIFDHSPLGNEAAVEESLRFDRGGRWSV